MGNRQLQVTCYFGELEGKELFFQSFLLYLRRELVHDR